MENENARLKIEWFVDGNQTFSFYFVVNEKDDITSTILICCGFHLDTQR